MPTSDCKVSQSQKLARSFPIFVLAGWLVLTSLNANAIELSQDQSLNEDFHVIDQFVQSHCLDCHVGDDAQRGFDLDTFELESVDLARWSHERLDAMEKMLLRISSGQMPPAENARPTPEEYETAIDAFRRTLASHARFDSHLIVRFKATPGKHRVGVTFVEKATDILDRQIDDASAGLPVGTLIDYEGVGTMVTNEEPGA